MGIALDEQKADDIHEVMDGITVVISPDDLEVVKRHGGVEIKYYNHSIWGGFDVRFKGALGALMSCKTCGDDTCA